MKVLFNMELDFLIFGKIRRFYRKLFFSDKTHNLLNYMTLHITDP